MAFFDDNFFSPQTYQGGMSSWLQQALQTGLLGRAIQQQQEAPLQPQTGPTFARGNQGSMGGVPFPIFGQPPVTNEMSAQAVQQQIPQQPSIMDRIGAMGFNTREAGIIPGIMGAVTGQYVGGKPTDDIREYEYAKRQGFKGSLTDWMLKKRAVSGEYGLQPVWGVGPDGKPAVMQLGKSGSAIQSKLPEGFQVAREPIKMDAGTHWVILDPQTRQAVATVPKELAKAEEEKKFGQGQGEARSDLASQTSKFPGLEKVVSKLDDLSEKATYTVGGQLYDSARRQLDVEPREGSVARAEYEAVVSNQVLPLLRDTFGAQFTEREGATLRATLGDPNKSPKEKQAVLRSFIEQKQRDIESLQRRTGVPITETPAPSSVTTLPKFGEVRDGYRFGGGDPSDPKNWKKQ